ncbi:hypothetical protein ABEW05_001348 [Botrytis cinerea]
MICDGGTLGLMHRGRGRKTGAVVLGMHQTGNLHWHLERKGMGEEEDEEEEEEEEEGEKEG